MSGAAQNGISADQPDWPPIRRVVTGIDAEGRSCALFDGVVMPIVPPLTGSTVNLWRSASLPADNTGNDDLGSCDFELQQLNSPGCTFLLVKFPPGVNQSGAWMHATNTLDYMIVLMGEVTLVLETGNVVLRGGDVFVDRGVIHGWRNDSAAPASAAVAIVPALPLTREKRPTSRAKVFETIGSGDTREWPSVRRVVTGLDVEARSCTLFDGPVPPPQSSTGVNLWRSASLPADNSGSDDQGSCDYEGSQLHDQGSAFMLVQHPPRSGLGDPQMHSVDMLTLTVIMKGNPVLVLETAELELQPGDILVERGVMHGWRNRAETHTLAAVAIVPALPSNRLTSIEA